MKVRDLVEQWLNEHKGADVDDTDAAYEHFVNILVGVTEFCMANQMEEVRKYMMNHSWYNKEWYNYYDEMIKELGNDDRS